MREAPAAAAATEPSATRVGRKRVMICIALVFVVALSWNGFTTLQLSSAMSERSLKEEAILSNVTLQMDLHHGRTSYRQPRDGDEKPPIPPTDNRKINTFPRTINVFDARTKQFDSNGDNEPSQKKRRIDVDILEKKRRQWISDDANYPIPQDSPHECLPMPWHNYSFPNCNSIHEIDVYAKTRRDEFHYLASGGFNTVFRVHTTHSDVALKLLSRSRQIRTSVPWSSLYNHKFFEVVRRDALVAERLTKSPYVLPLYGYCGFATVAPYAADGGTLDSALETKSSSGRTVWANLPPATRLTYIRDIAKGLADLHEIDVVHRDMSTNQYIFWEGRLQLGDFNQCILSERNHSSPGKACTFTAVVNDGVKRSPEEYMHTNLTSAVDVWSFGSILYHLLTGKKVWSQSKGKKRRKKDDVQAAIIAGDLPKISSSIRNSSDPVDKLLMKALDLCQVYDASKRATAREIIDFLQQDLEG